jgi:hypothetical protein
MPSRNIITICSETHTKHTNTLYGKGLEFLKIVSFYRLPACTQLEALSISIDSFINKWTCASMQIISQAEAPECCDIWNKFRI